MAVKGWVTKEAFRKFNRNADVITGISSMKMSDSDLNVFLFTAEEVVELKELMKSATWDPYYYGQALAILKGE
jgi:hypothetical protein